MEWVKELVALLGAPTMEDGQIRRMQALKEAHLPAKLYKFRAVTPYALENLRTNTVWMCSTDKYNDPYECAYTVSHERFASESVRQGGKAILTSAVRALLTEEDVQYVQQSSEPLRALTERVIARDDSMPPVEQARLVAALMGAVETVQARGMREFSAFMQRNTKVCSFSARSDSVVMWGHYAASHAGFCLEYDLTALPAGDLRRLALYPVIYSPTIFDLTEYLLVAQRGNRANNISSVLAAIQKAPDWSYENEWRLVLPLGEEQADLNFAMPPPTALLLGVRTPPADAARLVALADELNIPVHRMQLAATQVRMDVVPFHRTPP